MTNSNCIFYIKENPLIENELAYVLFDAFPVTKLHSLIIPKRHVKTFFELTLDEKNQCFDLLDKIKKNYLKKIKVFQGLMLALIPEKMQIKQ